MAEEPAGCRARSGAALLADFFGGGAAPAPTSLAAATATPTSLAAAAAIPAPRAAAAATPAPLAPASATPAPLAPASAAPAPAPLGETAAARGFAIEALLTTVPEPGLGFDGAVDALTRGLEAAGYTLDRFWLPWVAANAEGAGKQGPSCAARHPGLALFVSGAAAADGRRRLLLLWLVGESPSAGVHKDAFVAAAREAGALTGARRGAALRLVGPAFAGGATSLALSLDEVPALDFRVISGSVCDARVRALLTGRRDPQQRVTFHATTLPDTLLADAFYDYLVDVLGARARDIALITESSTPDGQAMIQRYAEPWDRDARPHRPRLVLPVPMHLARVARAWGTDSRRPAADKKDQKEQKDADLTPSISRALPYVLDERADSEAERGDRLPSLSRDTALSVDRALGTILTTIYDERVRYVGLFTTDARDRIFLARQIRKFAPDVLLFTFGSDLLYTHPDLRHELKGMLVISAYPLFTRNQQWSFPHRGWLQRFQFTRDIDQGMYNAVAALLDRPRDLLEYSAPVFSASLPPPPLRPVPWVAAVGVDALFPLAVLRTSAPRRGAGPDETEPLDLVYTPSPGQVSEREVVHSYPYQQGTLSLSLFALCVFSLFHCLGYLFKAHGPNAPPRHEEPLPLSYLDMFRRFHLNARVGEARAAVFVRERRRQLRYVLGCLAPLLPALLLMLALHLLQLHDEHLGRPALGAQAMWLAWLASTTLWVLIVTLGEVGVGMVRGEAAHRHDNKDPRRPPWLRPLIVLGVAIVGGVVLLYWPLLRTASTMRPYTNLLLAMRRTALPSYGLSPAVPFLALLAGSYLWGVYNLRRIRLLEKMATIQSDLLAELGDDDALRTDLHAAAHSLESPPWYYLALGVVASGILSVTLFSGLTTLEGRVVNWLFRFLFSLVSLFIWFSFLRFLRLWAAFRHFLNLLGHQRMAQAFDRMPPKFARTLGVLLLEELPELTQRETLAQHWNLLSNHLRQLDMSPLEQSVTDSKGLAEVVAELKVLAAPGQDPRRLPPRNPAPGSLLVLRILKHFWSGRPIKGGLDGRTPAKDGAELGTTNTAELYLRELPDSLHLWLRLAEDFIAVQVVAYIDRLFPHLRNALLLSTLGMLLMLAASTTYPFQPANFLTLLVWIMIFTIVGMTFFVLVEMNRDEVLSRIAKSVPGQISWDRRFVSQLLVYVAVPVLSLLATQFPVLHEGFFFWVEPVLKILK